MWRPSLADKQVDNVEVVVMDSDVQRSQAILQTQDQKLWIKQSSNHLLTSYSRALCVCLTFPAALGFAPLSNNSSATSTFPYFDATWSGVKPFCGGANEKVDTTNYLGRQLGDKVAALCSDGYAGRLYLGHLGLLSLHVQQDTYSLCMTFPGSDV